jgi:uncharacterized protein
VCTAAAGLGRYRIDNSLRNWAPAIAGHEKIATYAVIGGGREVLNPQELAPKLEALNEVMVCVTPDTVGDMNPLLDIRRAPKGRHGAAFDDPDYTGLFCFAKRGVGDAKFMDIIDRVLRDIYGEDADRLALGGPAVFTTALNDWSQRRLPLISVLIIVLGSLMLRWVVKRTRAMLSATVAIVGSQVALVGAISWLNIPMDMVVSMTWPLMMALGYSFAAHRVLRRGISGTLALCVLTTSGGIFAFVFCDFPPIRAFATWGAVGLLLTWASVMLLVTPVSVSTPFAPTTAKGHSRVLINAYTWLIDHPRSVVAIALIVILSAAACLPQLSLQGDPIRYFPDTSRVYRDYQQLNSRLIGMLPFEVSVSVNDKADAHKDVAAMLAQTPGVRLVVNVSVIDPKADQTYLAFADGSSLSDLVAAQPRWQAWATEHDLKIMWAGVAAQLHEVSVGVSRVAVTAFPVMVLIAGLVVFYTGGRDWRLALIGAVVNIFPIAVLTHVVVILGWRLSLPSLMIGAIAVGIAIDDTLHIVAGLRDGVDIRSVLMRCWRPCVGSSLIAAFCLALFMISPFAPTAEFGLLMALAILSALVGDMILLPAAVILMRPDTSEIDRDAGAV